MQKITYQHHGGDFGHWLRRIIHISLFLLPIFYYWWGDKIAQWFFLTRDQIVSFLILLIIIFEIIRIWRGWIVVGQRHYEHKQISAFAWGTIGIGLVLLIAPKIGTAGAAIGLPIIWSLSFVDPLLGELRRFNIPTMWVMTIGLIAIWIIWGISWIWLATPWILLPLMAPITIAAEWPSLKFIDDNATMCLIPLAFIIIIFPWIIH